MHVSSRVDCVESGQHVRASSRAESLVGFIFVGVLGPVHIVLDFSGCVCVVVEMFVVVLCICSLHILCALQFSFFLPMFVAYIVYVVFL